MTGLQKERREVISPAPSPTLPPREHAGMGVFLEHGFAEEKLPRGSSRISCPVPAEAGRGGHVAQRAGLQGWQGGKAELKPETQEQ